MKKHYRKENNCLNCGTTGLQGHYCHNCGQENLEIKESFGHMMNHTISDYFHFDHQFFHTIKPLLFKPGFLTTQYMAGKRSQFLHPVKAYIFISVVYFLLYFHSGGQVVKFGNTRNPNQTESVTKRPNRKMFVASGDTTISSYEANQKKLSPQDRDGYLSTVFAKSFLRYNDVYGNRAQEQFEEDIQHNVPKMMFVLLPLFALFLSIAFKKNQKFYVEHLIYTFHLLSFMFLFLSAVMVIEFTLPTHSDINQWLNLAAALYVIWYFYKSLRVVYQRSKFRTITKMIGLTFADLAVTLACTILLVFITALL